MRLISSVFFTHIFIEVQDTALKINGMQLHVIVILMQLTGDLVLTSHVEVTDMKVIR